MSLKREVSLYTLFGVLTTLISIVSYRLFLFNLNYMIATTLSTILAISFAYITNRIYVFKSSGDIGRETFRFLIGRVLVYFVETGMLILLVSQLKADAFMSKILVTVIVIVLNYIYSKLIVFKEDKSEKV